MMRGAEQTREPGNQEARRRRAERSEAGKQVGEQQRRDDQRYRRRDDLRDGETGEADKLAYGVTGEPADKPERSEGRQTWEPQAT